MKTAVYASVTGFFTFAAIKAIIMGADFSTIMGILVVLGPLYFIGYLMFTDTSKAEKWWSRVAGSELFEKIASKLAIGLLWLFGIGLIYVNVNMIRNYIRTQNYPVAHGYVINYKVNNAGYYDYDYYFDLHGKRYYGKKRNTSVINFYAEKGTNKDGMKYDGIIEVYYNPDDPNDYVPVLEAGMDWFLFVPSLLLIGLFTKATYNMFFDY